MKQSCAALSITPTDRVLLVSIEKQAMAVLEKGKIFRRICHLDLEKSPLMPGRLLRHARPVYMRSPIKSGPARPRELSSKAECPQGQVYGQASPEDAQRNLITSRILRLRGLEMGKNCGEGRDSYKRYIYIHGSNHEDRIGQPFSGGCVEMLNADVIELFDRVDEDDLILIC
jgi:hypothetical protein